MTPADEQRPLAINRMLDEIFPDGRVADVTVTGHGSLPSVFAVTAWVTLTGMWVGASFTDWLADRQGAASFRNLAAPSAP